MCFASNTFQSWDFRGITEILRTALPDTSLAGGRFSADRIKPPVAVRNCPHGRAARRCCKNSCYRSEEHTSELQSLMRISYAVFCLKKKTTRNLHITTYKYRLA